MKTTNYYNTFIEIAEDCPVRKAEKPPQKIQKTVANMQYEMIAAHPYRYTSDDVIFQVYAAKNSISADAMEEEQKKFFLKGQACLRCSPLGKRYGWGIHCNEEGKIALYAMESADYKKFSADKKLEHVKAMRSKK